MNNYFKHAIEVTYNQNRHLSCYNIAKIVGCSLPFCEKIIREFKRLDNKYTEDTVKLLKDVEDFHLEKSIGFKDKGLYFLFTKIAEKELKTDGFKILNGGNFSDVELEWLRINYKFVASSKYL